MKQYLWQKEATATVDERIMQFLAGEDITLDRTLFCYDVEATAVHVEGLQRIGVLDQRDARTLIDALRELEEAFRSGEFVLQAPYEDSHSAIEAQLTEKLGDLGKKVHTGRSRNDQVLIATRLYLRDSLLRIQASCSEIATSALERAEHDGLVPMPGYTHLQRAVPSSTALWFAGYAEAFIDNAVLAQNTLHWVNANPLGTAAGYGVNLALDREGCTRELGCNRMQLNPIYAQNSRGKFELQGLFALAQALLDVRRLAWDLSLFCTEEFAFVTLPDRYTTGSSIMPNKRNPDVVELLRAAYAPVQGAISEIQSLLSLPSGYHRDLQASKGPFIRAMEHGIATLGLVSRLLRELQWNEDALERSISHEMYATDLAVELAQEGIPFREAYRQVAASLDELKDRTPEISLRSRISPGACGDLRLEELQKRLTSVT